MKKNYKVLISIFCLIFSTLTIFLSIESLNMNLIYPIQNDDALENLETSGFWNLTHIHINNNWSAAEGEEWCYKENGIYIIENVTIDASNSPTGSGILIQNSITDYFIIRNCTIYNGGGNYYGNDAGIKLENTENGMLIGNNCSNNGRSGIYIRSGCENITIANNTLNNNANDGLTMHTCTNNLIENNTANGNDYGIYTWTNCQGNMIKNNILRNNTECGIFISHNNGEILSGNVMENCGILFTRTPAEVNPHTIYTNNTVNGKPVYYIVGEKGLTMENYTNAGQIILVECNDSIIEDSSISYSSGGVCLYFCENITVRNMTLTNHLEGGILLHGYAGACNNNNIYNNTFEDNGQGIYLYAPNIGVEYGSCDKNLIYNNTFNTNYYGILLSQNCDLNNISKNIGLDNTYFVYLQTNCDNNTIHNNTGSGGNRPFQLITGCDNNTVTNNKFSGGSFAGLQLQSARDNIVKYNTIIDSTRGIYIANEARENRVMHNLVRDNEDVGIRLDNAHGNYVFNNTVINTGSLPNQNYGIHFEGTSTNNQIIENYIYDNTDRGIWVQSSHNNSIIGNIASNMVSSDQNYGILLTASHDNNLTGNTANDNYNSGIYLANSDRNRLVNNTCLEHAGIGSIQVNGIELLSSCEWNVLIGNNASGNSEIGIVLDLGCSNNHLEDNIAQYNSVGIELTDSCSDNTIVNNIYINNNTGTGIHLVSNCDDNDIQGNKIFYNQYGIVIESGCNSNTFWSNQIVNNTDAGVAILSGTAVSQNNLFYNNVFSNPLGQNAFSNCSNNDWNNALIGNDWHDYVGVDANDDGIGDTPYVINGTGNNQDTKPIFEDGQDVFPGGIDPALIGGIVAAIVIPLAILGVIGYIYYKDPDKVKNAIKKIRS